MPNLPSQTTNHQLPTTNPAWSHLARRITETLAPAPTNPKPIATVPDEFKPSRTDRSKALLGNFGPTFGWRTMYWHTDLSGGRGHWYSPEVGSLLSISNPPHEWALLEEV